MQSNDYNTPLDRHKRNKTRIRQNRSHKIQNSSSSTSRHHCCTRKALPHSPSPTQRVHQEPQKRIPQTHARRSMLLSDFGRSQAQLLQHHRRQDHKANEHPLKELPQRQHNRNIRPVQLHQHGQVRAERAER